MRHRLALAVIQVGAGGVEALQLAIPHGVRVVAELPQQGAGLAVVAEVREARGGLAIDDGAGGLDAGLAAVEVPRDLGVEVVDVVEHHLIERADPGLEVPGHGDVQNQGQAVAAGRAGRGRTGPS